MIEIDPDEQFESDFSDQTLRIISHILGPPVKDLLLLPGPVSIREAEYAPTGSD